MTPIQIVDWVGVRYCLWMRANRFGIALNAAMERVVRAVGRIVVCVEAAAEVSTMKMSRWYIVLPKNEFRRSTSRGCSACRRRCRGWPSPMPLSPTPANDWAASVTIA